MLCISGYIWAIPSFAPLWWQSFHLASWQQHGSGIRITRCSRPSEEFFGGPVQPNCFSMRVCIKVGRPLVEGRKAKPSGPAGLPISIRTHVIVVCLFCFVWFGLVCLFGLVWFGLVWFGLFVCLYVCFLSHLFETDGGVCVELLRFFRTVFSFGLGSRMILGSRGRVS